MMSETIGETKLPPLPEPCAKMPKVVADPANPYCADAVTLTSVNVHTDDQMLAYGKACAEAARLEVLAILREQVHPIAEFLYGHTREKAKEWAKEDKYDSEANKADEILEIVAAAIRKGE